MNASLLLVRRRRRAGSPWTDDSDGWQLSGTSGVWAASTVVGDSGPAQIGRPKSIAGYWRGWREEDTADRNSSEGATVGRVGWSVGPWGQLNAINVCSISYQMLAC